MSTVSAENIYPLPIRLAEAASANAALHAGLHTLGQLGYRFRETGTNTFTGLSADYPILVIRFTMELLQDQLVACAIFAWETSDYEDERIYSSNATDERLGRETVLRAVAGAINAERYRIDAGAR